MSIKKWKSLKEKIRKSEGYWVEKSKLDFTGALFAQMKSKGMTKSALARKLGLSAPYISRVMAGDENLTIESMVKLASSVGGRLHIHISDQHNKVDWIECTPSGGFKEVMTHFGQYEFDEGKSIYSQRARISGASNGDVPA
ncbi:helix-turn-helix domain-containing protein [Marinobacter piscensis]|uniref:helix-turn-helix domain-containing protein n=1 Tax=Marinobacter piscensis TaxID=1562308 RepID=UPI0011AAAE07|nr:helix-turn-helix transcriptional regulator [Marinobacter piscensis]